MSVDQLLSALAAPDTAPDVRKRAESALSESETQNWQGYLSALADAALPGTNRHQNPSAAAETMLALITLGNALSPASLLFEKLPDHALQLTPPPPQQQSSQPPLVFLSTDFAPSCLRSVFSAYLQQSLEQQEQPGATRRPDSIFRVASRVCARLALLCSEQQTVLGFLNAALPPADESIAAAAAKNSTSAPFLLTSPVVQSFLQELLSCSLGAARAAAEQKQKLQTQRLRNESRVDLVIETVQQYERAALAIVTQCRSRIIAATQHLLHRENGAASHFAQLRVAMTLLTSTWAGATNLFVEAEEGGRDRSAGFALEDIKNVIAPSLVTLRNQQQQQQQQGSHFQEHARRVREIVATHTTTVRSLTQALESFPNDVLPEISRNAEVGRCLAESVLAPLVADVEGCFRQVESSGSSFTPDLFATVAVMLHDAMSCAQATLRCALTLAKDDCTNIIIQEQQQQGMQVTCCAGDALLLSQSLAASCIRFVSCEFLTRWQNAAMSSSVLFGNEEEMNMFLQEAQKQQHRNLSREASSIAELYELHPEELLAPWAELLQSVAQSSSLREARLRAQFRENPLIGDGVMARIFGKATLAASDDDDNEDGHGGEDSARGESRRFDSAAAQHQQVVLDDVSAPSAQLEGNLEHLVVVCGREIVLLSVECRDMAQELLLGAWEHAEDERRQHAAAAVFGDGLSSFLGEQLQAAVAVFSSGDQQNQTWINPESAGVAAFLLQTSCMPGADKAGKRRSVTLPVRQKMLLQFSSSFQQHESSPTAVTFNALRLSSVVSLLASLGLAVETEKDTAALFGSSFFQQEVPRLVEHVGLVLTQAVQRICSSQSIASSAPPLPSPRAPKGQQQLHPLLQFSRSNAIILQHSQQVLHLAALCRCAHAMFAFLSTTIDELESQQQQQQQFQQLLVQLSQTRSRLATFFLSSNSASSTGGGGGGEPVVALLLSAVSSSIALSSNSLSCWNSLFRVAVFSTLTQQQQPSAGNSGGTMTLPLYGRMQSSLFSAWRSELGRCDVAELAQELFMSNLCHIPLPASVPPAAAAANNNNSDGNPLFFAIDWLSDNILSEFLAARERDASSGSASASSSSSSASPIVSLTPFAVRMVAHAVEVTPLPEYAQYASQRLFGYLCVCNFLAAAARETGAAQAAQECLASLLGSIVAEQQSGSGGGGGGIPRAAMPPFWISAFRASGFNLEPPSQQQQQQRQENTVSVLDLSFITIIAVADPLSLRHPGNAQQKPLLATTAQSGASGSRSSSLFYELNLLKMGPLVARLCALVANEMEQQRFPPSSAATVTRVFCMLTERAAAAVTDTVFFPLSLAWANLLALAPQQLLGSLAAQEHQLQLPQGGGQPTVAAIFSRMCRLALADDKVAEAVDMALDQGDGLFGSRRQSSSRGGQQNQSSALLARLFHLGEAAMALMRLLAPPNADDDLLTSMAANIPFRAPKRVLRSKKGAASVENFTLAHAIAASATALFDAVARHAPGWRQQQRGNRSGGKGEDDDDDDSEFDDVGNDDDGGDDYVYAEDDDESDYDEDDGEDRLFSDQELVAALQMQQRAVSAAGQQQPAESTLLQKMRTHCDVWKQMLPQHKLLAASIQLVPERARNTIFG